MNPVPVIKDVVLVGGGHSHALLIRAWAMRPVPGVRLTLVSDGVTTPYSGMLPGLVAGHYTADDAHVDLWRLCAWANVRFIDARMTALDPEQRSLELSGRPPLQYDVLALDTGSTPDLRVPGAAEHVTPVKPVSGLAARWQRILSRSSPGGGELAIAVVGSGAGGFEMIMAVHHALRERAVACHWLLRGERPLGGRHRSAQRAALAAARAAGIQVHTGFDVARVQAGPVLAARDGRELPVDEVLWCTGASGPPWPARAGLSTDARGFILTDAQLRSVSHPDVFASGDIGTQRDTPSPKAGVHAVRQAPVLLHNLKAVVLGEPLRAYRPQRDFLSLMATGPQHAIASRGPLTVSGRWVWRWKDRIDRTFMQRFDRLPPMAGSAAPAVLPNALRAAAGQSAGPRCRGCGAKVASDVLSARLRKSSAAQGANAEAVVLGLDAARDVSIVVPGERAVVQSVDQLSALFDDPYRFARIATLHALNDVFTVAATPHSVLLTLTLPPALPALHARELDQLFAGVDEVLHEHGMQLIGGHTAQGPQLQIGLTVNAFAESAEVAADPRLEAGDVLALTRPLGSGVLFAGAMRAMSRGEHIAQAMSLMGRSSAASADRLRQHGARIMTDVTGFGLAGHLQRLLQGSGHAAVLDVTDIPWLSGARVLAQRGVRSSLFESNRASVMAMQGAQALDPVQICQLADPQTAGGLLAVLPANGFEPCRRAFAEAGDDELRAIGVLEIGEQHRIVTEGIAA